MDLRSAITKNVITEVISTVVSLLSSVSHKVPVDQITYAIELKMADTVPAVKQNNDIGMCVESLMSEFPKQKKLSLGDFIPLYAELRHDNEMVSNTIAELSEKLARNISPILYELREVIPQQSAALAAKIDKEIPSQESAQDQLTTFEVFTWGKLADPAIMAASMLAAQDRTKCFRDGVARQHDPNNVLRRVPYQTASAVAVDAAFFTSMVTALTEAMNATGANPRATAMIPTAMEIITAPNKFSKFFAMQREYLQSADALSTNIVTVVNTIDACEDVLRSITVEMLNLTETGAALANKVFENIELALVNISLLRASMIFHKVHTLQNKLILSKTAVQASALETFQEAGGTEKMIRDHYLYMDLTPLQKIPTNGLSLDVVLNSSARAKAVVQQHAGEINTRAAVHRLSRIQDSVTRNLEIQYKAGLESGAYHLNLGAIHEEQVQKSLATLKRRSIDDIALEYLITMENKPVLTRFFKAINKELTSLVKAQPEIKPELVSEAICGGVVSVLFDVISEKFSVAA